MDWCVYLLRCKKGYLYIGITNNLDKRLKAHHAGKGAKFTKAYSPCEILSLRRCETKSEALKLEYKLKQLKQADKYKAFGLLP